MSFNDIFGIGSGHGKKKYKIGDKVTYHEGFTSHEYEITSKRGADAMNYYQPESHEEFKKFTRVKKY